MRTVAILITTTLLCGCGAEVAGTAAVTGTARQQEAQEAEKHKERVKQQLDAAQEAARLQRERTEQMTN